MGILKENSSININDEKIHYKICKKISKNDISSEEIQSHNNFIIENDLITLITNYSFMGSYFMNKYLREDSGGSDIIVNVINKLGKILTNTPPLKNDCEELDCANNLLKSLPNLPNCEELKCEDNMLESLPDLPKCEELICSNNSIKELPKFLPLCTDLICDNNKIKQIPDFPLLESLSCDNNPLKNYFPHYEKLDKITNSNLPKNSFREKYLKYKSKYLLLRKPNN